MQLCVYKETVKDKFNSHVIIISYIFGFPDIFDEFKLIK